MMRFSKSLHFGILATAALVAGSLLLPGQQSARPDPTGPVHPRPAWLSNGAVLGGYLELPSFYIRRGGEDDDITEQWKANHAPAMAKVYKEMGVNVVVLSLHKGAGLQAEAEEIAATKIFTEALHKEGIKVAGYVGASMFYETFYGEEPGSRDWAQINERGGPMFYGT